MGQPYTASPWSLRARAPLDTRDCVPPCIHAKVARPSEILRIPPGTLEIRRVNPQPKYEGAYAPRLVARS
jgi:hypothetical protein